MALRFSWRMEHEGRRTKLFRRRCQNTSRAGKTGVPPGTNDDRSRTQHVECFLRGFHVGFVVRIEAFPGVAISGFERDCDAKI